MKCDNVVFVFHIFIRDIFKVTEYDMLFQTYSQIKQTPKEGMVVGTDNALMEAILTWAMSPFFVSI